MRRTGDPPHTHDPANCVTGVCPKNLGSQLGCANELGFSAAAQKAGRADKQSNILTHSSDGSALKI